MLWNPGFRDRLGDKPCKGGADSLCRPYMALPKSLQPQGFGRFAAFALGFAVPRFQRWRNLVSLTRMRTGAVSPVEVFQLETRNGKP